MRKIPLYLRTYLASLPRMKQCVLYPLDFGQCEGRIEWDHVWIYAGKQINEIWAILGVCKKHHAQKEGNRGIKAAIQLISLNLATTDNLEHYPRKDWEQERRHLVSISTARHLSTADKVQ